MKFLLVGASARAIAFSAIRAGYTPICADLFGDLDLREHAKWIPLGDYPFGILSVVKQYPGVPIMFTGGYENHPDLLRDAAGETPILGNDLQALKAARDPFRITAILQAAGLPALELRERDDPPEWDGNWIFKPGNRAAGFGIVKWDHPVISLPQTGHFQRFMPGQSCSAVFLSVPQQTILLGITEQLIGLFPWAEPFAWCGSVGPLQVNETVREMILLMGSTLAEGCGLHGLWGMDFILNGDEVGVCEINPRYPASLEILEHATGLPFFDWHVSSFVAVTLPDVLATKQRLAQQNQNREILGKLILYADHDLIVPAGLFPPNDPHTFPRFADIPEPGSEVKRGVPICTLFAQGRDSDECKMNLVSAVRELKLLKEDWKL